MSTKTANFKYIRHHYNEARWHVELNRALDAVDSKINEIHPQFSDTTITVWKNSTAYSVGDIVVCPDTANFFECTSAHTSDASETTPLLEFFGSNHDRWKPVAFGHRYLTPLDMSFDATGRSSATFEVENIFELGFDYKILLILDTAAALNANLQWWHASDLGNDVSDDHVAITVEDDSSVTRQETLAQIAPNTGNEWGNSQPAAFYHWIYDPMDPNSYSYMHSTCVHPFSGPGCGVSKWGGRIQALQAIHGFKFVKTGGNFTTGRITVKRYPTRV